MNHELEMLKFVVFTFICESYDMKPTVDRSTGLYLQQEDLSSLGKVILALACNSIIGIQRDRLQTSMEIVNRNYSADLRHFLMSVYDYCVNELFTSYIGLL